MDKIFVKIASYRDRELPLTIQSALNSAKYPERVTFGVCWQYDEQTYLDMEKYIDYPNVRIMQTYYENSKGCCWARHHSDLLYQGEEYTLQIDAHTRFAQDWDERFIAMLESLDCDKPLLTTYPAPFTYINGEEHRYNDRGVQKLVMNRMRSNLTTIFRGAQVKDRTKLERCYFIGAGQVFTHGRFCEEVQYDPNLYYAGEEISLSARAYTHGYDFFCPNEDLLWHLYQHSMPVHSTDHKDNQHDSAVSRLHTLFIEDHTKLGRHGLGSHRPLSDYEAATGLDFKGRINRQPVKTYFKQNLKVNLDKVEEREDYDLWIFALRDVDDNVLLRKDLRDDQMPSHQHPYVDLDVVLEDEPVTYSIMPHSRSVGFHPRHIYDLSLPRT